MYFIKIQSILSNIIFEDGYRYLYMLNEYGYDEYKIVPKQDYVENSENCLYYVMKSMINCIQINKNIFEKLKKLQNSHIMVASNTDVTKSLSDKIKLYVDERNFYYIISNDDAAILKLTCF